VAAVGTSYSLGTLLYPFTVTVPNNKTVGTGTTLEVQIMLERLMDWAPYLWLQTPAQWQFAPTDLNQLCARVPCH
jgi:hypothetical protein